MKKIFIVEDDKSICMELVEILENEGYAASYLTDFEHSKEEILATGADLILMDIMMPNMDGHQAAKAIRALGIERSDAVTIPIIALSANAFIDDIQESLDSGMNDHISKPINMEELIDTITKYIKHDQENKEVNSDEKFALVLSSV